MLVEILYPNGNGIDVEYSREPTSIYWVECVTDGDDATYIYNDAGGATNRIQWLIAFPNASADPLIDEYYQDSDSEPSISGNTIEDHTRIIGPNTFESFGGSNVFPKWTGELLADLQIGQISGVGWQSEQQLFALDDPTFPDLYPEMEIARVVLHGRIEKTTNPHQSRIYEMSLAVYYCDPPVEILSGNINMQSGQLIIK
tara:strand:+ start:16 stop:615 length:600 start_codon:yes stop_codon:yes gene_type:complete